MMNCGKIETVFEILVVLERDSGESFFRVFQQVSQLKHRTISTAVNEIQDERK